MRCANLVAYGAGRDAHWAAARTRRSRHRRRRGAHARDALARTCACLLAFQHHHLPWARWQTQTIQMGICMDVEPYDKCTQTRWSIRSGAISGRESAHFQEAQEEELPAPEWAPAGEHGSAALLLGTLLLSHRSCNAQPGQHVVLMSLSHCAAIDNTADLGDCATISPMSDEDTARVSAACFRQRADACDYKDVRRESCHLCTQ